MNGGLDRWMPEDRGHDTPCWIWQGARSRNGYSNIGIGGHNMTAHKAMYEREVGPVPEGKELDHLCRVRDCVNPAHLEPVTRGENMQRGVEARTHCRRGHEYNEANTRYTIRKSNGKQRRDCRVCRRKGISP